jgi:ABC-2 type transport system permease protein
MNKVWLVIQREYWIRVRKKSFLLMTLLSPLLFAALMVIPAWIASTSTFKDAKIIQVLDQSGMFKNKLPDAEKITFKYVEGDLASVRKKFELSKDYALLIIPPAPDNIPKGIKIISEKNVSVEVESAIEKRLENIVIQKTTGIEDAQLKKLRSAINIQTETKEGKDSSSIIVFAVAFAAAFMIYISIFIYGAQVMRAVIEEKTSRIIEVMISSIKPIQLMMGKIIGVAAVGLTQFLLWIVLTFAISTVAGSALSPRVEMAKKVTEMSTEVQNEGSQMITKVLGILGGLDISLILVSFLFYFVFGYLLYSSLFAAVGSAGDSETDAQQFMLPVTMPLILSIIMVQNIIQEPNSNMAFWFSIVPFTAPVCMMARLPSGVPTWELILSMFLMIVGFVSTTWVAARIYRIGILMYGKKVSFKEIGKWMFMKQ